MAQLTHNFDYAAAAPGKGLARQAQFYRVQIRLAAVVGLLTLSWVLYASPRQEMLLKSIQAQTLALYDELVAGEAGEMRNGKNRRADQAGCDGKIFKAVCGPDRKLNSAEDVITCLLRQGATKLQAALS